MNGARRYLGWITGALIVVAFVTSLVLPKDHHAWPLGPGCYWSATSVVVGNVQAQVCDEWRKPGSTLPVPD